MNFSFPTITDDRKWILHLIFYRIPKNASTSMMDHLGQFNLIKKNEALFHSVANKKIYKGVSDPTHAKPDEAYVVFKNELQKYFSFLFLYPFLLPSLGRILAVLLVLLSQHELLVVIGELARHEPFLHQL